MIRKVFYELYNISTKEPNNLVTQRLYFALILQKGGKGEKIGLKEGFIGISEDRI
jgi:hypothetical protein